MGTTIKAWLTGNKKFEQFKKTGINVKLLGMGILGILLLLASAGLDSPKEQVKAELAGETKKTSQIQSQNISYEEELESKLANILSRIKGAGTVSVNVTLENGSFSEHAKNTSKETRTIEEKDSAGGIRTTTESKVNEQVLIGKDGGIDRPVMVREYKPVIKGIVVVAEGADDSTVKANLTKAIEAGFGLPAYKIVVLAQRK